MTTDKLQGIVLYALSAHVKYACTANTSQVKYEYDFNTGAQTRDSPAQ